MAPSIARCARRYGASMPTRLPTCTTSSTITKPKTPRSAGCGRTTFARAASWYAIPHRSRLMRCSGPTSGCEAGICWKRRNRRSSSSIWTCRHTPILRRSNPLRPVSVSGGRGPVPRTATGRAPGTDVWLTSSADAARLAATHRWGQGLRARCWGRSGLRLGRLARPRLLGGGLLRRLFRYYPFLLAGRGGLLRFFPFLRFRLLRFLRHDQPPDRCGSNFGTVQLIRHEANSALAPSVPSHCHDSLPRRGGSPCPDEHLGCGAPGRPVDQLDGMDHRDCRARRDLRHASDVAGSDHVGL